MLCDHIVFWERHRRLPTFTPKEMDGFFDANEHIARQILQHLTRQATAKLVARIRSK